MKKKLLHQPTSVGWFWVYGVMLLVILMLGFLLFFSKNSNLAQQPVTQNVLPANNINGTPGLPVRLKIPSIEVDAMVESVGITPEGAMGIPEDADNVAWYNLGSRPGEQGSAVIDGHFDKEDQSPAVFAKLDQLMPGDVLYLENDQNETLSFVVKESRMYDVRDSTEEIFNNNEGIFLNLITCAGTWDTHNNDYNQRRVIFAELVK
jgi:sortase A